MISLLSQGISSWPEDQAVVVVGCVAVSPESAKVVLRGAQLSSVPEVDGQGA